MASYLSDGQGMGYAGCSVWIPRSPGGGAMVMRFDPFRELDRLTQDTWGGGAARRSTSTAMPIDAYRQGDRFLVHFDLPGVDPSTVELTVEKNVLTVRAERSPDWGPDAELVVAERPQGAFT